MELDDKKRALRSLPAVNSVLQLKDISDLIAQSNYEFVSQITTQVINREREKILNSDNYIQIELQYIIKKIISEYEIYTTPSLDSIINGTGIILHTNLGRAKLSVEAVDAIKNTAINYSNLEYNINIGKRGSRYEHVEHLLKQVTGAEAALVVNNNAGAVFLILNELAQDLEVIVSRGQLVEIGGSFRVSEIMYKSGANLVEVGTTNKTYTYDYQNAITDNTALLMKVHTSNFKTIGFTNEVSVKELVELGREVDIPIYEDLGSGLLYDFKKDGIGDEPTVQEVIKAGADIVSFSGDKLLGGPQTGIIVGKKELIDRVKKNQLTRTLRVDKMTLAALEATLRHYLLNEATEKIPTLNMILMDEQTITNKSEKLFNQLASSIKQKASIEIIDGSSQVGGGSFPDVLLPTKLIAIKPIKMPINSFEKALRTSNPYIIGRLNDDQYLLDIRTIEEKNYSIITEKINKVLL